MRSVKRQKPNDAAAHRQMNTQHGPKKWLTIWTAAVSRPAQWGE